jgi:hypothetical protein
MYTDKLTFSVPSLKCILCSLSDSPRVTTVALPNIRYYIGLVDVPPSRIATGPPG